MNNNFVKSISLSSFRLLEKIKNKRIPYSFYIELTARCNLNCRHCYINLPVQEKDAFKKELLFDEIKKTADEIVSLGAIWCLISRRRTTFKERFF